MANLAAVEGPLTLQLPGLYSGDDLSAAQFHFVKLDASVEDEVHLVADGDVDMPIGVLLNNPNAGAHETNATGECQVLVIGVCKVVAGADLSASQGLRIGSDDSGQAVLLTNSPAPAFAMGVLINGSTSGGMCTVLLLGPQIPS